MLPILGLSTSRLTIFGLSPKWDMPQLFYIDVINNNRIDAKYCQMVFQLILTHLPEILEEQLFGTPGQTKVML